MHYEDRRGEFLLSTDPGLMDAREVHAFLTQSYWAPEIPLEVVRRSIEGSLCFAVHDTAGAPARLAGFARVITDRATFAYLADVFVTEPYRGRGLSTWMMERILAHPDLHGLRRFCLLTRDAHALYARYGFAPMPDPTRYMEINDRGVYQRMRTP